MQLPMDIRMASTAARFGFVFAHRGITLEAASSWFLPRLVGMQVVAAAVASLGAACARRRLLKIAPDESRRSQRIAQLGNLPAVADRHTCLSSRGMKFDRVAFEFLRHTRRQIEALPSDERVTAWVEAVDCGIRGLRRSTVLLLEPVSMSHMRGSLFAILQVTQAVLDSPSPDIEATAAHERILDHLRATDERFGYISSNKVAVKDRALIDAIDSRQVRNDLFAFAQALQGALEAARSRFLQDDTHFSEPLQQRTSHVELAAGYISRAPAPCRGDFRDSESFGEAQARWRSMGRARRALAMRLSFDLLAAAKKNADGNVP